MVSQTLYSSKSDEWSTPSALYDALDAEFGFTLDPCSTEDNHKCNTYYTKEQDGLKMSWGGVGYSVTRRILISVRGLRRRFVSHGKTIRL